MRLSYLLIGALIGGTAWGGVIIGNISPLAPSNGNSPISVSLTLATGFTMNAGPDYNVTDVGFVVENFGAQDAAASGFHIGLFGDSGGAPTGSALTTFSSVDVAAGATESVATTPLTPFQLQASTTYWLILYDSDPSISLLVWRDTATFPSGPGAVFAGATLGSMTSPTQVNHFPPGNFSGSPYLRDRRNSGNLTRPGARDRTLLQLPPLAD